MISDYVTMKLSDARRSWERGDKYQAIRDADLAIKKMRRTIRRSVADDTSTTR